MLNRKEEAIEVGDYVKIITSIRDELIGKVFKVIGLDSNNANVTIDLDGYCVGNSNSTYLIGKDRVALFKKKQENIFWTKPDIAGANCTGCGKFSEYHTSSYTCFECKNV